MKITNVEISGVASAIVASGYAMRIDLKDCPEEIKSLHDVIINGKQINDVDKKHLKRLFNLSKHPAGSGHRSVLKGITVAADFMKTQCLDHQMQRYNFFQYITGQSTMHRVKKMSLKDMCHEYTSSLCISECQRLIGIYNNVDDFEGMFNEGDYAPKTKSELFQKICYSLPAGLQLTVRATTNYECLLTMYFQRLGHKLSEWKEFCDWVYSLPLMKYIIDNILEERRKARWQTKVASELEPYDGERFVAELENGETIIGIVSHDCILHDLKHNGVKRFKLID